MIRSADARAPDANPYAGEPEGNLFGLSIPMARVLAMRGEQIGGDRARVRMVAHEGQGNSRGDVHGGAIAALLDCTLAAAVRAEDPVGFGVATIDLTLHYVSVGRGDLVATAQCDRRGRSISFARGEVHDANGQLVAMATGTFKLVART